MSAAVMDANVIVNRAKAIAAMGLVERSYEGFNVVSPGIKKEMFRVWRDNGNHVRCNCTEFECMVEQEPRFRCEHILAVKFHLHPPPEEQSSCQSSTDQGNQERIIENIEPEVMNLKVERVEKTSPDFANVLNALSQPVSSDKPNYRIGLQNHIVRENEIDHIGWHTVADMLDHICPEWSHQVNHIQQIGDIVAVTASITINGVTRQGVGTGSAYGEKGIKKAEHDALKHAAVKFGIARDLSRREDDMNNKDNDKATVIDQKRFPSEPVAKTMADLVTPKQLVAIRAISHAQRVNAEAECIKLMSCRPEELTRRAASAFIDHLKSVSIENDEVRQAG